MSASSSSASTSPNAAVNAYAKKEQEAGTRVLKWRDDCYKRVAMQSLLWGTLVATPITAFLVSRAGFLLHKHKMRVGLTALTSWVGGALIGTYSATSECIKELSALPADDELAKKYRKILNRKGNFRYSQQQEDKVSSQPSTPPPPQPVDPALTLLPAPKKTAAEHNNQQ